MSDKIRVSLQEEAEALIANLQRGDGQASVNLARLIQADSGGALQPFAEALTARLCDHLQRLAEIDITDPEAALQDEVYELLKLTAIDWDGLPGSNAPGESKNNVKFE